MFTIAENTANGTIRRETLIRMRCLAICGQTSALLLAHYAFHLPIDLLGPLCIILASVALNGVAMLRLHGKDHPHNNKEATLALGFDTLQLASLLFFTGGFTNPFIVLMFTPVAIAATVLSGRSVYRLVVFSLICYGLMFFATPLPWPEPQQFSPLFLWGCACAVFISGAFLVLYIRKVAREARRLSIALNTSRLELEYEQKISAFGALAAAVAHELGSPLSTIAIISTELAHALKESEHSDDIELLQSQVSRCSTILTEFSKHNVLSDRAFEILPLRDFMLRIMEPYRREAIAVEIITNGVGAEPKWPLRPGLMHGLGNILHNACKFSKSLVLITLDWDHQAVTMTIEDDGPGFPDDILPRLGHAYVSGRQVETGGHPGMGLGLFIAKMLLERSGGNVIFANSSTGGAEITLSWPFQPN